MSDSNETLAFTSPIEVWIDQNADDLRGEIVEHLRTYGVSSMAREELIRVIMSSVRKWSIENAPQERNPVASEAVDEIDSNNECPWCHGLGHFDEYGKRTADESCRRCVQCDGTGLDQNTEPDTLQSNLRTVPLSPDPAISKENLEKSIEQAITTWHALFDLNLEYTSGSLNKKTKEELIELIRDSLPYRSDFIPDLVEVARSRAIPAEKELEKVKEVFLKQCYQYEERIKELEAENARLKSCAELLNEPLKEADRIEMIRRLESWGYWVSKRHQFKEMALEAEVERLIERRVDRNAECIGLMKAHVDGNCPRCDPAGYRIRELEETNEYLRAQIKGLGDCYRKDTENIQAKARQIEELEAEVESEKAKAASHLNMYDIIMKENESLGNENDRYREALEKINGMEMAGASYIAREALKDDSRTAADASRD